MHLASQLVQNDHADRTRRPFHPFDKRYRGGGDRPRSVEELDAELHCRMLRDNTDGRLDVCDTAYLLAIPRLNGCLGEGFRTSASGAGRREAR
jgi:hypothetical protein